MSARRGDRHEGWNGLSELFGIRTSVPWSSRCGGLHDHPRPMRICLPTGFLGWFLPGRSGLGRIERERHRLLELRQGDGLGQHLDRTHLLGAIHDSEIGGR